jgi:hypothetical protein
MPVPATRFLRHMRGGAQAHLLEAGDGHFYVTKFRENPQHLRILVNEWIAARLIEYLQIAAPPVAIVELDQSFLARELEVKIRLAARETPVGPGWHFGSRFPGHPDREAVYDYLPDSLLAQVYNLPHFRGIFAFDKWTANSDSRQAIFVRQRISRWIEDSGQPPLKKSFLALMIDNGYAFDGPHWEFADAPAAGFYFRPVVYRDVRRLEDFNPWLERIREAPPELFDGILRDLPRQWLAAADEPAVEQLIEQLYRRRARVADLIAASAAARPSCFTAWTGS